MQAIIQTKIIQTKNTSDTSDTSDSGYSYSKVSSNTIGVFGCFYCNESFHTEPERLNHRELAHPNNLNYPTAEDFENRLKPNG